MDLPSKEFDGGKPFLGRARTPVGQRRLLAALDVERRQPHNPLESEIHLSPS
jgi:hypothetical protein